MHKVVPIDSTLIHCAYIGCNITSNLIYFPHSAKKHLIYFPHGTSRLLLPNTVHVLALYFHGSQTMEEIQNQPLKFKSTPRAMEATYCREHAPVCWLSTPSCIERHGNETWPPYAPSTWRSFYRCGFITRVCRTGDENSRY